MAVEKDDVNTASGTDVPPASAQWEAFLNENESVVYYLALFLTGDEELAQQIVEDVFVELFSRWSDTHVGSLRPVVLGLTYQCYLKSMGQPSECCEATVEERLKDALHPRFAATLYKLFDKMSPVYRDMMVLREIGGCTAPEIAEVTQRSVRQVCESLGEAQLELSRIVKSSDGVAADDSLSLPRLAMGDRAKDPAWVPPFIADKS